MVDKGPPKPVVDEFEKDLESHIQATHRMLDKHRASLPPEPEAENAQLK